MPKHFQEQLTPARWYCPAFLRVWSLGFSAEVVLDPMSGILELVRGVVDALSNTMISLSLQ